MTSTLERLQADIERLSPQDFARLREWFTEKDWEQWDKEIEADSAAGKLDFLLEEVHG